MNGVGKKSSFLRTRLDPDKELMEKLKMLKKEDNYETVSELVRTVLEEYVKMSDFYRIVKKAVFEKRNKT